MNKLIVEFREKSGTVSFIRKTLSSKKQLIHKIFFSIFYINFILHLNFLETLRINVELLSVLDILY